MILERARRFASFWDGDSCRRLMCMSAVDDACGRQNASWESLPQLLWSFSNRLARFSTAAGQRQRLLGQKLRPQVHVASFSRAGSEDPDLSTVLGGSMEPEMGTRWSSTIIRFFTQSSEVQRGFCSETPRRRGEETSVAESRGLQGRILRFESRLSNVWLPSLAGLGNKLVYCQQMRHYSPSALVEGHRWMRITGAFSGPLASPSVRHPFLEGGVRFKSRKKQKKAKAKKREVLSKIKRMRVFTKKRKEEMTPEERLEFRLEKGRRKVELIKQAIAKFPVQEIPPEDPDIEVLTPEQLHYLKKIGYKNKNYLPVGRRGIYGGTIQNMHMHWKKHETVQVEIAGFSKEEVKVMAVQLARLSGGIVIDIHQKNIVILYRGRNYKMPKVLIPMKTLDKRKALAKSKLEQSMKALLDNDIKVEKELIALRRENEQRQSGEFPGSSGEKSGNISKFPFKLEDPDEYSEVSSLEDSDDGDFLSDELSESEASDVECPKSRYPDESGVDSLPHELSELSSSEASDDDSRLDELSELSSSKASDDDSLSLEVSDDGYVSDLEGSHMGPLSSSDLDPKALHVDDNKAAEEASKHSDHL